jgi:hypothetical protein
VKINAAGFMPATISMFGIKRQAIPENARRDFIDPFPVFRPE